MNKKILIGGIAAIILVVIIAIIALFFLKGKKEQPSDDALQMAEDLQDFMSGYSKDEIAEILDEELTDDQLNTMDDALISIAIPEYGEDITSNSACISII